MDVITEKQKPSPTQKKREKTTQVIIFPKFVSLIYQNNNNKVTAQGNIATVSTDSDSSIYMYAGTSGRRGKESSQDTEFLIPVIEVSIC